MTVEILRALFATSIGATLASASSSSLAFIVRNPGHPMRRVTSAIGLGLAFLVCYLAGAEVLRLANF